MPQFTDASMLKAHIFARPELARLACSTRSQRLCHQPDVSAQTLSSALLQGLAAQYIHYTCFCSSMACSIETIRAAMFATNLNIHGCDLPRSCWDEGCRHNIRRRLFPFLLTTVQYLNSCVKSGRLCRYCTLESACCVLLQSDLSSERN
jgi:hypothetical protein